MENVYFSEKPHCLERLSKTSDLISDIPAGLSEALPGTLHSQDTGNFGSPDPFTRAERQRPMS